MVVGGGEEGVRVWVAFGEEERGKNHVFHVEERIYNLYIFLSKLVSLSGSLIFALSMTIHAERNSSKGIVLSTKCRT